MSDDQTHGDWMLLAYCSSVMLAHAMGYWVVLEFVSRPLWIFLVPLTAINLWIAAKAVERIIIKQKGDVMASNEHPDMSGNPCDDPMVCDQCDGDCYEGDLYGSVHDDNKNFCCQQCVDDFESEYIGTTQVKTWADLLAAISKMSPEQQQQPIQCVRSEPDDAVVCECLPGISVGTVSEMGFYKCRSTIDNKYRGDDLVLLIDGNPYSPDGAMMHRWNGRDWEPCYEEGGPTDPKDQMSPEARADQ